MTSRYCHRQRFPDSRVWARVAAGHFPAAFTLELTARCTLDCRHCYVNLPAGDLVAQAQELTFDEIVAFAGEAVALGALWCALTGGDPLLRADFAEIYRALHRLGLLVSVFTNATLITPEHARLWRAYPPRELEVTVYGGSADTYEYITRRSGSYAAFLRGLELLRDYGIPVRLKALVLRGNQHELPEMLQFCQAHTKDRVRYSALVHLRTDGDSIRNAAIRAERLSPQELCACRWPHAQPCPSPSTPLPGDDTDHGRLFHCTAGMREFMVNYLGQYRLCALLVAPGTTYNLRAGSLSTAWKIFTPAVRAMLAENAEQTTCDACAYRPYCTPCPALSYLETGKLQGIPTYFCAIKQALPHKRQQAGY